MNKIKVKYFAVVLIAFCIVSFCGCQHIQRLKYQNRKYQYVIVKGDAGTLPVVMGKLYYQRDLKQLVAGALRSQDSLLCRADTSARFSVTIKPGWNNFIGRGMGFEDVKTHRIKLKPGDTLKINFYLPDYERRSQ